MDIKREGFALVESIVSISIVSISMYIISTAYQNSSMLANTSKHQFEMLELARRHIEYTKLSIKNNEEIIYEKDEKGYKINTTIHEEKDYYNCYKVEVSVSNKSKEVRLKSYATKE